MDETVSRAAIRDQVTLSPEDLTTMRIVKKLGSEPQRR
jgi:hypothetical protein